MTAVEDRLADLEREVAALKRCIAGRARNGNWIEQITGSMEDEPEFEKVLELGRLARRAQTASGDDQA